MNNLQDVLLISIVGFIILAIINVNLAKKKGRKEVIWVYLTFFLGFFATIMLVLADKVGHPVTGEVNV